MVHTVVLAALVIGIVAIIPSAMAHHTDDPDEAQCKKWHIQAINDYVDKGQVSPGIQKLLMECLQDGYDPDDGNLPPPLDTWYETLAADEHEEDSPPSVVLDGLVVELYQKGVVIPSGPNNIVTKFNPCPPGQIIIDRLADIQFQNIEVQPSVIIEPDRTTVTITSSNKIGEGLLTITTPCLGLVV
jgi:hypothetical protein